jgi:hypothetical protein
MIPFFFLRSAIHFGEQVGLTAAWYSRAYRDEPESVVVVMYA